MQAQDGQANVKRGRQARNTGASQLANEHIGERIRLRRTPACCTDIVKINQRVKMRVTRI